MVSLLNQSISCTTSKKALLNDIIAKKIFKNEKYGKALTARIVSDLLNLDYQVVFDNLKPVTDEIAFSALTVSNSSDIVYSTDKFYINIEINYRRYKSKPKVLLTYIFQLSLGQLHTYEDYNKMKEVIQISIDAYDFFDNKEFMYKCYLTEEKTHERISDMFTMYHFNLAYLRKVDYNIIISKEEKLMYDLYFLICDNDELLNIIYQGDDFMCDIISNARQIAGREKLKLFLTEDDIIQKDEEFIRNESFENGIQEAKHETILNLLKKNMSLENISDVVNLSIDEVKKIINESKNKEN